MLNNPPTWTQNGVYSAEQDRRLIGAIVRTEGVVNSASMVPTVIPNTRQVSISGGGAYIKGDYSQRGGGMYFIYNDGAFEVAVPVAGSIARYDLLVLRIYDSDVSGSVNEARFSIISGTPATSPKIPAVPASAIAIAAIKVNPGATQLQLANLSDQRDIAQLNGGITGNVTTAQSTRLNQQASPSNPVLITRSGAANEIQISTGGGFQTVGGTSIGSTISDLPKSAPEGSLMTLTATGRTYQFRKGAWRMFAGAGVQLSFGRTTPVAHTGPYIGGLTLNASAPASWGQEAPTSTSDYASAYAIVKGTSGTTLSRAGGITFKKPGKYFVEVKYQMTGRTANTAIRSRIAAPGVPQFSSVDNQENYAFIGKGQEYTVSTSGTVQVGTGYSPNTPTYGKLVPWLRTSSTVTLDYVLVRVEMEYEF